MGFLNLGHSHIVDQFMEVKNTDIQQISFKLMIYEIEITKYDKLMLIFS